MQLDTVNIRGRGWCCRPWPPDSGHGRAVVTDEAEFECVRMYTNLVPAAYSPLTRTASLTQLSAGRVRSYGGGDSKSSQTDCLGITGWDHSWPGVTARGCRNQANSYHGGLRYGHIIYMYHSLYIKRGWVQLISYIDNVRCVNTSSYWGAVGLLPTKKRWKSALSQAGANRLRSVTHHCASK